jgi:hypothetical protein
MGEPAHPIAIIGAGPIGLAAASRLVERGEPFVLFEAGQGPGTAMAEWGHVQLFSPWRYVIDPSARELLDDLGWQPPDLDDHPTGADLVGDYLTPLATHPAIAPHLRFGHRVTAITRAGADKLTSGGREELPFELLLRVGRPPHAEVLRVRARAVIDASGTWFAPNPLGSDGLPVDDEPDADDVLTHRIPDARGADRDRYAGRTTVVVGSGHSAFNALLELAALADEAPGTEVLWAIRRPEASGGLFGGGAQDALARRGALGTAVRRLVETGRIDLRTDFRTTAIRRDGQRVVLAGVDHLGVVGELGPVDEVVALTGFRPDLSLTSELRVSFDPVVESTPALAPLIDPNVHSCGTVPPHGAAELAHPESGYYAVGMKSYGRAPTFLLLTGYEQVRSVVAALAGDDEAATNVELELPATGVCSGPGLADDLALVGAGVPNRRLLPQAATSGGCC